MVGRSDMRAVQHMPCDIELEVCLTTDGKGFVGTVTANGLRPQKQIPIPG